MLGAGTITIDNTTWQVSIAADPVDLMQGLGGLAGIPADTGELFDLGSMQTIRVTTAPMLFNLDIAMLDDNLKVTEIYRDVPPGYLVTSQSPAEYFLETNSGELANISPGDQATVMVTVIPVFTGSSSGMSWSTVLNLIIGIVLGIVFLALIIELARSLARPKGRLQADNRPGGKFFIETDPMGDIIIRHSGRPDQSVFLHLQDDKEAVLDLLKPGEKKDLNSGWPVEVKDSEPRASTLQQIWDVAAIPSSPDLLPATSTIPPDKRAEIEKKYGRWATNLAMAVCPYGDVKCVEREARRFYQSRDIRDQGGNILTDNRQLDRVKYVTVLAPGQTAMMTGDMVTIQEFMKENMMARKRGETPATGQIWEGGYPITIKPQTVIDKLKKQPSVWLRIGDRGKYEDYDSPYVAGRRVARALSPYNAINISFHYVKYGVEIPPRYEHQNYISLFRGDAEAEPEREITSAERKEFERGVRETLQAYLAASQPVSRDDRPQNREDGGLDYLADDQEFLAYTIEDIGYRDKIDTAFLAAMRRARGGN